MSGAGTFAVQAQPSLKQTFIPKPKYWIVYGTYAVGEVLDISTLSASQEIVFPTNIYSMSLTFNAQNQWDVASTLEANASVLKSKRA